MTYYIIFYCTYFDTINVFDDAGESCFPTSGDRNISHLIDKHRHDISCFITIHYFQNKIKMIRGNLIL